MRFSLPSGLKRLFNTHFITLVVQTVLQSLVEDRRHVSLGECRLSYVFIQVVDGSL